MDLSNYLSLIGGLALFLFGMEFMGENLTTYSGPRLKKTLASLTSNTFKALMLGIFVTVILQSSSATTVIVIGLVNSGVLFLDQAITVIMGANIGTTITSWLLSLTGIESNNFLVNLLNPNTFAPILAIIAVFVILQSENERKKTLFSVMLGFSVLMFGMQTMTDAVSPLAYDENFQQLLTKFENPFLGIITGTIVTAALQSSSASIGILQAISLNSSLTMRATVPIIMGQNIGTTITAAVASIGAQRSAKRVSLSHFIFNGLGTIIFSILLYGIGAFVDIPFLSVEATPFLIAIAHTIFNLASVLILINFIPLIEKIAFLILPRSDEEIEEAKEAVEKLDERLLDTPTLALSSAYSLSVKMFQQALKNVRKAFKLINKYKDKTYQKILNREDKVDAYEAEINSYLLKMGSYKTNEDENKTIIDLISDVRQIESISDDAVNLSIYAKRIHDEDIKFTDTANEELDILIKAVKDYLDMSLEAYDTRDPHIINRVEKLEKVIDALLAELKLRHLERLMAGVCDSEQGVLFTDILTVIGNIVKLCGNVTDSVNDLDIAREATDEVREIIEDEDIELKYELPDLEFTKIRDKE